MRLDDEQESSNVEDRRGFHVSKGVAGGGIGSIALVLIALFFGIDPSAILQENPQSNVQEPPSASQSGARDEGREFVARVLGSSERVWGEIFQQAGRKYVEPKLVLFSGQVQSACGFAQAAAGPFYCGQDQKVYIDLAFYRELRERKYDLILERGPPSETEVRAADDLNIETLFDDQLVIVADSKNKWATRRRKIDLAELVNEPWIMQAPHVWNHRVLSEAFRARGLGMPRASLVTLSMSVITHFLAGGRFITSMPRSVAHFKSLKILPLDLPSEIGTERVFMAGWGATGTSTRRNPLV